MARLLIALADSGRPLKKISFHCAALPLIELTPFRRQRMSEPRFRLSSPWSTRRPALAGLLRAPVTRRIIYCRVRISAALPQAVPMLLSNRITKAMCWALSPAKKPRTYAVRDMD